MEEESPQKDGLVGIFDILGYQYIIDNNQINYVVQGEWKIKNGKHFNE
jgi:hypothetical protein